MYTTIRHELRHARKALPGALVGPCLLSGHLQKCLLFYKHSITHVKLYLECSLIYTDNGLPPLVMTTLAKRKRESFDKGVFLNIEAKRTPSKVSKLFSQRSEHIRQNKNYFRSEANTFDSKKTGFKAKRAHPTLSKLFSKRSEHNIQKEKLFSKRSEHIRQTGNYFRSKANTSVSKQLFSKLSEHIRQKENYFGIEANALDRKKIIFEAKRTRSIIRKLFSKRSENVRQ